MQTFVQHNFQNETTRCDKIKKKKNSSGYRNLSARLIDSWSFYFFVHFYYFRILFSLCVLTRRIGIRLSRSEKTKKKKLFSYCRSFSQSGHVYFNSSYTEAEKKYKIERQNGLRQEMSQK